MLACPSALVVRFLRPLTVALSMNRVHCTRRPSTWTWSWRVARTAAAGCRARRSTCPASAVASRPGSTASAAAPCWTSPCAVRPGGRCILGALNAVPTLACGRHAQAANVHQPSDGSRNSCEAPTPGCPAGGSIHRDDALMRKLYGHDVLMADVVAGRVPLPPEVRCFEWHVQLRGLLPGRSPQRSSRGARVHASA